VVKLTIGVMHIR